MNAAIAGWWQELDAIEADARAHTDGLRQAPFTWRPGPGQWSIGECLDHQAITTGLAMSRVMGAPSRR